MEKLLITSKQRAQIIDITPDIRSYAKKTAQSGIIFIHSPHTTAGLTVNENADPDVKTDMLTFLNTLVPNDPKFLHNEGNSDAHIKGTLVNFSLSLIVENGTLQLGTWQGVYFMEFDGPRSREVWLTFIPGA